MNKYKKAFTLVELIVVITILAILGTIAFISLQGYSKSARDSVRISDMSKIKTILELFQLNAGKYPIVTDGTVITYSGLDAWTQGTFGEATFNNVEKLDKIPTDPLTEKEYTYSTTNTRQEFQIAGIMEGDEVSFLPNQANAAEKTATLKITGNYNGKILKVLTGSTTYILAVPSIITSSGITLEEIVTNKLLAYNGYKNLSLQYEGSSYNVLGDDGITLINNADLLVFSGDIKILSSTTQAGIDARAELITNLQNAYTLTTIASIGEISQIINTSGVDAIELLSTTIVNNDLGGGLIVGTYSLGETATSGLIDQTTCESANWIWIDSATDVYIGTSQGDGFCISPRYGDWNLDSNDGNGGISFNGWGYSSISWFYGWNPTSLDDTGNSLPNEGQTKILDSEISYDCKTLGTATTDYDIEDNIVGRMKWLATTGNTYDQARSIDWITGLVPHTVSTYPQALPALYIADCIDGVKDLTTTMTYTHNNDTSNEITYADYTTDITTSTSTAILSDITYQNRQKYLTAWTQKSGSHLPSAYSYITSGFASASDSDGDYLTGNDRGEYQVACENGLLTDANDSSDGEDIWLSSIGFPSGVNWGHWARKMGSAGCLDQSGVSTGDRISYLSARFVIRP